MLIMTTSPSTSAASTAGLRDRIVASVMVEVGSVLDTVGIAVAPPWGDANSISDDGRCRAGSEAVAAHLRPVHPRSAAHAALLARAAGCYGARQLRPRRWAGDDRQNTNRRRRPGSDRGRAARPGPASGIPGRAGACGGTRAAGICGGARGGFRTGDRPRPAIGEAAGRQSP